jgi:tetratricopeptide (TPR) repeat protein
VSFETLLAAASRRGADPQLLAELAGKALESGEEERALPLLRNAVERAADGRLWQWKALLERALDEHAEALASFGEAARLAPGDASIAHGRARVALEAGVDAEALYEQALLLAPSDGQVLLGLMAARMAAGNGATAEAELDAVLGRAPLWIEGHLQLAQLRSMLGRRGQAADSLERALATNPTNSALWLALLELALKQEDYDALDDGVARAREAGLPSELLAGHTFIAASELGRADPVLLSDALAQPGLAVWLIRHFLRTGSLREAAELVDREMAAARAAPIWPYAATVWRATGDPRSEWLERSGELISVTRLLTRHECDALAASLRALHVARGEFLDQSVRGGTQTDGPLLSRIDPAIRALRSKIVAAVGGYVAQLPTMDPAHPTLGQRRDRRTRFAGSWSVRLSDGGFHAAHVHPQGWISSALYVSLPRQTGADPHAGWLTLGAPPGGLGIDLAPLRKVEPKAGHLALFPSWMWHGTIPFAAGERLTAAFDVAPPGPVRIDLG